MPITIWAGCKWASRMWAGRMWASCWAGLYARQKCQALLIQNCLNLFLNELLYFDQVHALPNPGFTVIGEGKIMAPCIPVSDKIYFLDAGLISLIGKQ